MSGRLKVGFLSNQNAYNRNSYSGALYFMYRSLEAHPGLDIHLLGGYKPVKKGLLGRLFTGSKDKFKFDVDEFKDLDVVIAPVASDLVAQFGQDIEPPIILITDTTPSYLREFYPEEALDNRDAIEVNAFKHVERVVYSSRYMADRAKNEFDVLADKQVNVAPLGVNLDVFPNGPKRKHPQDPLEMVFIGKNWSRKGGDIAMDTLDELIARGINARLKIIGPSLPKTRAHPNVDVLGYIDKHRPNEVKIYEDTLRSAHILVSPTRADCTPMVVAEANMFSCPVVITEVGGVGSLIKNGVNGEMLQVEDEPKDWADMIERLTVKNPEYDDLCVSSFQFAQLRLSWDAWAQTIYENAYEVATP